MNFSNKTLRQLNLDEVIHAHLTSSDHSEASDHILRSCLHEVEQEMCQARGFEVTAQYAPVMCAFALLDQIGTTYSDLAVPSYPHTNASGIKKALYYWASYAPNGADTKALCAFRNGIDHEGALTNQTTSGDWYMFRYQKGLGSPIKLATSPWDGTAANIGPNTITLIDVRALTELTSSAIEKVRDCFTDRRSELKEHQTKEDILHKYIFWTVK